MNIGSKQPHESRFGPSSAIVSISDFLQSAEQLHQPSDDFPAFSTNSSSLRGSVGEAWGSLSPQQKQGIEAECRVDDIQSSLHDIITDPRLMSHVIKTHEASVHAIYETADSSSKRKRRRVTLADPAKEHSAIATLRNQMDAVQLASWPLTINSALFIRPPRQSDHNCLVRPKQLGSPSASDPDPDPKQALIFVTIYTPMTWGHKLVVDQYGHTSWRNPATRFSGSAVICIEGTVYGDGLSEEDYSDKLLKFHHLNPHQINQTLVKGTSMHDTTFSSLSLRLHQPYWLLHLGDCEHFFVVEEIRLHHPRDPPISAFPLTTQITPPLLDLCRACNKVPAVYSIVGDIRLGESPFVMCATCWRWLGPPRESEAHNVTVVPLPKYEFGWGG
ncbi:SNAPC3/SRD2 family protein [Abortiporus biennis]